jgi:hypothetical protein
MKSLAIIIWSFLFFNPVDMAVEKWVVEKNSSLRIEGKSNVNTYKCDIMEYLNGDTILLYKGNAPGQTQIATKGGLTLNINRFDCHQNHVTADLKKTLKATENAYMKINLLSFGRIQVNTPNQEIKGYVEIQLAGVTKKIEMDYVVVRNQPGSLHLIGTRKLLFSDFKLIPPRKLAGMIRVEEEITVRFQLMLRYVSKSQSK